MYKAIDKIVVYLICVLLILSVYFTFTGTWLGNGKFYPHFNHRLDVYSAITDYITD